MGKRTQPVKRIMPLRKVVTESHARGPMGKPRPRPGGDRVPRTGPNAANHASMTVAELRTLLVEKEAAKTLRTALKHTAKLTPTRHRRSFTTGSACTGWATEAQACIELGAPGVHLFGCDTAAASKAFCSSNFTFVDWIGNVLSDDFGKAPHVDCFSAGFPCQPYSTQGVGQGSNDVRANVLHGIMRYILEKRPKCVFLENVKGLLQEKHKNVFNMVLDILMHGGYNTSWKVLNSCDYGVAQKRARVYIVGIREDVQTTPFQWPPARATPHISEFLDVRREPKALSPSALDIVATAVRKIQKRDGVDAFQRDYVIDAHSGRGPNYKLGMCPTITAARGASVGFFHTRTHSFLSVSELARLQGFDEARYDTSMLTRAQFGALIGNAMTVTVVTSLLEQLLPAAGVWSPGS